MDNIQSNPMFQKDFGDLQKIVMAAEKLMYDQKTFKIFKQGMMKRGPVDVVLASEAAALIKMLDDKSKGTIPRDLLPPAAMFILMEMAKFMREAGVANPSEEDIKNGIKKLMLIVMKIYEPQGGAPGGAPGATSPQGVQPQQPPQPPAPPQAGGMIQQGA